MQSEKVNLIRSPFNYTGGKHRLLPQILPFFPDDIDVFADIFCGGASVGINASAKRIVLNDSSCAVTGMLLMMQSLSYDCLEAELMRLIKRYCLSDTFKYGYSYYGCDSSHGLSFVNRDGFNALRDRFNSLSPFNDMYFVYLFLLIVYSFNNQIRFNSYGKFNLPVGKRDFNSNMRNKLKSFMEFIQSKDCVISNGSFSSYDADTSSFVYADPPYLITCASYNENNGWNECLERELLSYLDSLNASNIRFALSNVLTAEGKENVILKEWVKSRGYIVNHLLCSYANSNYHKKQPGGRYDEVLITNFVK